MQVSILQLVVSVLLFFVLFFGIGFILNMILRMTWIMAVIYPIVVILIVDDVKFIEYFTNPSQSFTTLWKQLLSLQIVDIIILLSGFIGAIASGYTIKILREKGYQMF